MYEPSRRALIAALASAAAGACVPKTPRVASPDVHPVADSVEVIATGIEWSEGPLWVGGEDGYLLFSDVPGNAIHKWDGRETSVFLSPSGWAGPPDPESIREGGSNGLALGRGGLLIADSGNRCISLIDLQTKERTVIADRFEGKRFNSPNDLVMAANGDIYFTDPPWGLAGVLESPLRELAFTGVFRISPDNRVHLVADTLFPNGIALSPDERVLYVTDRSGWRAIDLGAPDAEPRLLVAADAVGGGGDGMKCDAYGNLWCSAPGGIHVLTPSGERIGQIALDGLVSNCAFGPGDYVYITNDDRVVRAHVSAAFREIAWQMR